MFKEIFCSFLENYLSVELYVLGNRSCSFLENTSPENYAQGNSFVVLIKVLASEPHAQGNHFCTVVP